MLNSAVFNMVTERKSLLLSLTVEILHNSVLSGNKNNNIDTQLPFFCMLHAVRILF